MAAAPTATQHILHCLQRQAHPNTTKAAAAHEPATPSPPTTYPHAHTPCQVYVPRLDAKAKVVAVDASRRTLQLQSGALKLKVKVDEVRQKK